MLCLSQVPAVERSHLPGVVGFFRKENSDPSNKEEKERHGGTEEEVAEETVGEVDQDSDGEDKYEGEEPRDGQGGSGPLERGDDCPCEEEEEDDDDDVGWITPENLADACEEMGGVMEEEVRGLSVACVTTDFAVQVIAPCYCRSSVVHGGRF